MDQNPFESRFSSEPPSRTPRGGRVPPHHLEAEKSVLGAILVQNNTMDKVHDVGLEPRDFYVQAHQKIFESILALAQKGDPIDLVTLTSALRDRGTYDQIGGANTLTSLFEDFSPGNAVHYARIVRDKALLRRMIETCSELQATAFEGVEEIESFMDVAEQKIFEVSETRQVKSFSSMRDVLIKSMAAIEAMAQKKSDIVGLPTGFTDFDKLTSGLRGGQLIILAARPAMGKTSLVLSAAQNMALNEKSVVLIFSLEMSEEEFGFKFLSGLSRIGAKNLKIGRIQDRDWSRLAQAADVLSKSKLFIDDSGDVSALDVRARARRLLAQEKRIDLIVIDYLQLMRGNRASKGGSDSREREISEISRGLKTLAKELNVPIIALSQLNRGVESRPNKRPMLSDLRESGAIEQDADIVCFIYRDEVYNPETEDKGVAELIVAKHRAGETATVRLAWMSEYTLFGNLAHDQPGAPISPPRSDRGDITL